MEAARSNSPSTLVGAARRIGLSAVVCLCTLVALPTVAVQSADAGVHVSRSHAKHHKKHHRQRHVAQSATRAPSSPASPATCANADTPATSASAATMDAAVDCLINQERVVRGLPALTESSQLDRSAQSWNDTMVASGNFTHGDNFASRVSAVGYDWQTAGENIATGYLTPDQVVAAWMASTDHCQNILDPSFRNFGTGETPSPVGSWASGPATWTQDFGLLMSQSALSANHGPQNGCPYN